MIQHTGITNFFIIIIIIIFFFCVCVCVNDWDDVVERGLRPVKEKVCVFMDTCHAGQGDSLLQE